MPVELTAVPGSGLLGAVGATPTVQRLRRVSQAGAPSLFRSTRTVTRYEHSVGVARLACQVGLPVELQVTALLHDSTHSAFSHTLDYLVGNDAEDTHEAHAARLMTDPALLELVGPDVVADVVEAITAKPGWLRLLDAVDYTVRDLVRAGLLEQAAADAVTGDLTTTEDGQVCFTTPSAAWEVVKLMAQTSTVLYMDQPDLFRHDTLAELLAAGIEAGVVTLEAIMATDDGTVLRHLCRDRRLRVRLGEFLASSPANLRERRDPRRITSKARLLDPPVKVSANEAVPLSALDPTWSRDFDDACRRADAGVALLTTT